MKRKYAKTLIGLQHWSVRTREDGMMTALRRGMNIIADERGYTRWFKDYWTLCDAVDDFDLSQR